MNDAFGGALFVVPRLGGTSRNQVKGYEQRSGTRNGIAITGSSSLFDSLGMDHQGDDAEAVMRVSTLFAILQWTPNTTASIKTMIVAKTRLCPAARRSPWDES